MLELRWNPVLREWVAVATDRQERPQMPTEGCPFCPGSGRVPGDYDVHIYANDFPTLRKDAITPAHPDGPSELYQTTASVGVCEVVLYHPDHTALLERLSPEHIEKVVKLW